MVEKIKTLASAAVTWLTFAGVALSILAEEIGNLFPDGGAEDVSTLIIRLIAWIGTAVAIVRRVTPVIPEHRGLTPVEDPKPIAAAVR